MGSSRAVTGSFDLDHVALASWDSGATVEELAAALGARPERWGATEGFRAVQCRLGAGMTIEVIEPFRAEADDFLRRFLERSGPGLHHVTLRTDDLHAALEHLEAAGHPPDIARPDGPVQRELFFAPHHGHGTVVQVIEKTAASDLAGTDLVGPLAVDPWWRPVPPATAAPATLDRVVLRTRGLDEAVELFGTHLSGRAAERAPGVVDVAWPSGTLRLEASVDGEGLHRIECRQGAGSTRAARLAGACFVISAA